MKIAGRTFIVSGGSSGLGLSAAVYLLSQGANVSLLDLQPPPPEPPSYVSVPIPLEQFTPLSDASRTLFTKTDVTSSESIAAALSSTIQWAQQTSRPLGGVVSCAGISLPALALPRQTGSGPPRLMPMEPFDKVLSINLRGTVDLLRQCLPLLASVSVDALADIDPSAARDEERGVIILVSSVAAYDGQVGQLSYSASKGAIASIVLPLARELGSKAGIRVVGIAPGLFESAMTFPQKNKEQQNPQVKNDTVENQEKKKKKPRAFNTGMIEYPQRLGRGEEFAKLVGSIVENPMINGTVIRLDGAVRMPSKL